MIRRFFAFVTLATMMTLPLFGALVATGEVMLYFVFFYPLLMSGVWVAGGMYFWFYRERRWRFGPDVVPAPLKGNPLVSILIPCFNEGLNVHETIGAALAQTHENIEVIAINDGSKDDTGALLNALALEHPRLRVLHLAENQGKAVALRMGAMSASSDFLVCIDGDAVLDPRAAAYLVDPLLNNPRVGAVTGNPRIRTRATLIGRLQVGEFSSIIGLIKRTQRVYGNVFTVSGVIAAFRRRALSDVGYWSPDMITEDIDISWKLQLNHWPVFYEPRALCWILMPETLKGIWKQRLRWAQGGAEVFLKYMSGLWRWKCRRMWTLFFDLFLSTFWAFTFSTIVVLYFVGLATPLPPALQVETLFPPAFTGLILATACLVQFFVSLLIDQAYEAKIGKNMFWVIWYPVVYWVLSLATTTVAFPKVMLRARQKRARWVFEDRGLERSRT